jgi:large subunit ribosomal protein L24
VHIKKGDTVEIISGDDKGRRGRVLRIDHKKGKVVVEGMNRVFKHLKPSRRNPQGGRLSREMPIQLCKVMLIDPRTGTRTRTGIRYNPDGSKDLIARKSGSSIRQLAGENPKYAQKV